MIHPATSLKYINKDVGFGVVASAPIPCGTIVWVQDDLDRVFEPDEIEALPFLFHKPLDHFTYRDNRGRYVLCWDHGRYINHRTFCNCMTTSYGFEIAIRDISVGEELTDDYGFLNLDKPFEAFPEEGTDRTTILPDDLVRFHTLWDAQLKGAFQHVLACEQPLAQLLGPTVWEDVQEVARGNRPFASILSVYFDDTQRKGADPGQDAHVKTGT